MGDYIPVTTLFEMFPRYEHLDHLKINSILKTLLAVSSWNLASIPFTKMVATAECSQDFADQSIE